MPAAWAGSASSSGMRRRAEFEEQRDLTRLLVGRVGRLEARADEAAARLQRLIAAGGADPAVDYWLAEGVLALAVHRARSVGIEHPVWAEAEAEIRERSRQAAMIQDLALMQVTRALEREGIPSVVLKGAPMARRLYGDAELRSPSGDLDLLVPVERLSDASRVVVRLGWGEAGDAVYADGLPDHHAAHPGKPGTPAVELHWRVQWYDRAEHSAGLLEGAEISDRFPVASPVDQLSILMLAFGRDGLHRLRLAADIAAWWDRWGADGLALSRLWTGVLARPHTAQALATSAVVGTPSPPDGLLGVAARRAVTRVALSDEPMPERSVFARVAIVDLLSAPAAMRRGRALTTWLRSPEYLAVRHPKLSARIGVTPLRVASAARTAARVPAIVWRAMRVRSAPVRLATSVCRVAWARSLSSSRSFLRIGLR